MNEMVAEQLADFMKAATTLGVEILDKDVLTEAEETFCAGLAKVSILLLMTQAANGGPTQ